MVQIISNFSVDHMSPSKKGWGADVQNKDRDTMIIIFLFYRKEGFVYWGGEGERSIYAEEQQTLKTQVSDWIHELCTEVS